jgi:hypothetical protein
MCKSADVYDARKFLSLFFMEIVYGSCRDYDLKRERISSAKRKRNIKTLSNGPRIRCHIIAITNFPLHDQHKIPLKLSRNATKDKRRTFF